MSFYHGIISCELHSFMSVCHSFMSVCHLCFYISHDFDLWLKFCISLLMMAFKASFGPYHSGVASVYKIKIKIKVKNFNHLELTF